MLTRILSALALLLVVSLQASAQTTTPISTGLTINWTAPTTADGGSQPLTGQNVLTSYNVYASTAPLTAIPSTPTATATASSTTANGAITASVGQTVYVYVTACNSSGCSKLSTAGTYVIPVTGFAPDVPTNVTITLNVTPSGSAQ